MRSHLPVVVTQGATEVRADGMEYDNLARVVDLKGRMRGVFTMPAGAPMSTPLAFITGASSGIGQALAARFHRAGYRLALVARRGAEVEAWALGAGIEAARAGGLRRPTCATSPAITGAGRACIDAQGLPDVVIANAGISIGIDTAVLRRPRGHARDLRDQQHRPGGDVPALRGARCAQRRSGTLVGIASVAGIRGLPGHGAYCSSKAAVISYCESLRGELRPSGVGCVTLCPGYVDTPLTRGNRYGMPFLMHGRAFADRAYRRHRRRHAATASSRGRWASSPSCCAPCRTRSSTACCAGRPRKRRQDEG